MRRHAVILHHAIHGILPAPLYLPVHPTCLGTATGNQPRRHLPSTPPSYEGKGKNLHMKGKGRIICQRCERKSNIPRPRLPVLHIPRSHMGGVYTQKFPELVRSSAMPLSLSLSPSPSPSMATLVGSEHLFCSSRGLRPVEPRGHDFLIGPL